MNPAFTVVIPHRSATASLLRLLPTLKAWPVLVVDDTDDGLDLDVPMVRLGGGSGFARAVNAGLAEVRTPFAVVLNDDAMPEADCLERLAQRGGLCGPVLLGRDGVESAGLRVRSWGRVMQCRDLPVRDEAVDALSGACLHLPATARFDERFPHGFEDVELCRRLGGAWLVAGARCHHEGGATVGRRTAFATQAAVTGQALCFEPGWRTAVVAGLHVAQVVREGGPIDRFPAIWRGVLAARGGR
ncbi:hypothetical protein LBMAG42_26080 [Deltaproteobacteria bacterium]|nr:hypothetical protein LBMAG42_26080 [Deltaproteobacteria bacterium]